MEMQIKGLLGVLLLVSLINFGACVRQDGLNCLSMMDEEKDWPLEYHSHNASITFQTYKSDAIILSCLSNQSDLFYRVNLFKENRLIETKTVTDLLESNVLSFPWILSSGIYRLTFALCQFDYCNEETRVQSSELNVTTSSLIDPKCISTTQETLDNESILNSSISSPATNSNNTTHYVIMTEKSTTLMPIIFQNLMGQNNSSDAAKHIKFSFQYNPCTPIFPYENYLVRLYFYDNETSRCQYDSLTEQQIVDEASITPEPRGSIAILKYKSPPVSTSNDGFYCLKISSNHKLCQDFNERSETNISNQVEEEEENEKIVNFCSFKSSEIYIRNETIAKNPFFESILPYIHRYIPFCTSHFRCGWIYLLIGCTALLTLSFLMAIICLYCCCQSRGKRTDTKKKRSGNNDGITDVAIEVEIPFNDLGGGGGRQKKTWADLHAEWDVEPPKNPGKILLLYSRDSKAYQGLMDAFKSFLEFACHCIVLDLFDDNLFDEIAFDPEKWLRNLLLHDPDFKIIIFCSEGAFKRQRSQSCGEVLNIPDNSSLDGLFSAGLKFIQDHHAYDYDRLATARYDMLPLTGPEFKLTNMVPNREFLVPGQLHDLFCWIHGYDPLDLLGQPWVRYHLELQLLSDSLKKARLDRKPPIPH